MLGKALNLEKIKVYPATAEPVGTSGSSLSNVGFELRLGFSFLFLQSLRAKAI